MRDRLGKHCAGLSSTDERSATKVRCSTLYSARCNGVATCAARCLMAFLLRRAVCALICVPHAAPSCARAAPRQAQHWHVALCGGMAHAVADSPSSREESMVRSQSSSLPVAGIGISLIAFSRTCRCGVCARRSSRAAQGAWQSRFWAAAAAAAASVDYTAPHIQPSRQTHARTHAHIRARTRGADAGLCAPRLRGAAR